MTYNQLIAILKARWRTIAAFIGAMLTIAIAINLLLPKKYTATASVLINVNSPDLIEGGTGAINLAMGASYMSTQIDIINSELVARRVVAALKLDETPTLRAQWQQETEGRGNLSAWAAKVIQRKLDVRPSKDSNVVNINYSSPDPKFSEVLANTFANVYIQTSLDLKTDPAKQYNKFFEARAKELKEQLERAQTRLSSFEREHGIIASDERVDVETGRLNNLAANLTQAQSFSAESKGRQNAATTNSEQLQDVLNNPVVSALKTDLSRQEARLSELSAKLGDAHPDLTQLRANISETKRKIEQETDRVSAGTRVVNVINKSRESEIAATYEAQRQKLLKLKQERDTAAVLMKDVEAAQRAYDAIQARLTQTTISSQSNQTNVSLLTTATEPDQASSPMPFVNIIAALVLGSLLGCGAAVVKERRDPRVRIEEDLTEDLNAQLLGLMPDSINNRSRLNWLGRGNHSTDDVANRLLTQTAKSTLNSSQTYK